MKSLLRIFLFATGMFSVNQVEAQIITINTYGRVEKKPSDNLSNDKSEAEILPQTLMSNPLILLPGLYRRWQDVFMPL